MTAPDTVTPERFGFTLTNPDDGRTLTFDTGGFVHAPDPDNGQGYALNPEEARYLAAALSRFADIREELDR